MNTYLSQYGQGTSKLPKDAPCILPPLRFPARKIGVKINPHGNYHRGMMYFYLFQYGQGTSEVGLEQPAAANRPGSGHHQNVCRPNSEVHIFLTDFFRCLFADFLFCYFDINHT